MGKFCLDPLVLRRWNFGHIAILHVAWSLVRVTKPLH